VASGYRHHRNLHRWIFSQRTDIAIVGESRCL